MAKGRTNWNQIIKNANKLNLEYIEKRIQSGKPKVSSSDKDAGIQRMFLSQTYDKFIVREIATDSSGYQYGYNRFLTEKEFKQMYGSDKEYVKEYRQQRKQFLKDNEISGYVKGTKKELEEISRKIERIRNDYIADDVWTANTDYIKTRDWDSKEWGMVDDFKKIMDSDTAVDLTNYILEFNSSTNAKYKKAMEKEINEITAKQYDIKKVKEKIRRYV